MSETAYEKATRELKNNPKANRIGYYETDNAIGEGNFAQVKIATHVVTGEKVAIKMIDKTKLDKTTRPKLYREVRIMKTLAHDNIVRLYEVIDTTDYLFLVLELASGGEIFDYLVSHGRMKEKDARKFFRQIVSAVDYCHQKRIIHRDLKAENLLLDNYLNIKLADFGFSNNFHPSKQLETWCGSPPYAAPELFQGQKYVGPEVDMWSLGVSLYVLVCGALPFDGTTLAKLRARILAGKFKVPFYMSAECENLIRKLLVIDTKERYTMEQVKADPWLNEGYAHQLPSSYAEPMDDPTEKEAVIQMVQELGISREELLKSLEEQKYDHIGATFYILLHRRQKQKQKERREKQLKLAKQKKLQEEAKRRQTLEKNTQPNVPDPQADNHTRRQTSAETGTATVSQAEKPAHTHTRANTISEPTAKLPAAVGVADTNKEGEPRTLRFAFSCSTTSSMPAKEFLEKLKCALDDQGIKYDATNFLLVCTASNDLKFEMEICKLPRLNVNGLRVKRKQGNSWDYKNTCQKVIEIMGLSGNEPPSE
eukprot:Nk52_evm1s1532 gene=Nk52_evmTU1s1532